MKIELSEEQWEQIDALILENNILFPIKMIRDRLGVSINEAGDIHHARYRQLREERPDDFSCSDREYWQGFY